MTISALLGGTTAGLAGSSATPSQATSASNAASPALAQAQKRIQADADVTTAQISKFGVIKSALLDTQVAAKAMKAVTGTTPPADVTTAMGKFFNAYNASVAAANAATKATASGSDADRAKRVVQDLKSSLSNDPLAATALKKLGLTFQTDGSLLQDPKKFAASMTSDRAGTVAAMAKMGSRVDMVSGNELGSAGPVGAALTTLNAHNTSLKAVQSAFKSLNAATSSGSAASSTSSTYGQLGMGLAAYQSNTGA